MRHTRTSLNKSVKKSWILGSLSIVGFRNHFSIFCLSLTFYNGVCNPNISCFHLTLRGVHVMLLLHHMMLILLMQQVCLVFRDLCRNLTILSVKNALCTRFTKTHRSFKVCKRCYRHYVTSFFIVLRGIVVADVTDSSKLICLP